ncbi:hypothetical protein MBLNU457_g2806t1 [Dothideomycetes sp. NU457]
MGLGDLLHFDKDEYAAKLGQLTEAELRKREIVKRRQMISSSFKIGAGAGLAPLTCGASLVSSVWGLRTAIIARQKTALLIAEFERRGLSTTRERMRDTAIPLATSIATFGVSHTVGFGVDSLVSAATGAPIDVSAPTTLSTTVTETIHYFEQGVVKQLDVVQHGVGEVFGSDNDNAPAPQLHAPSSGPAEWGFHQGEAAARSAETQLMSSAAQQILDQVLHRCEGDDLGVKATAATLKQIQAAHTASTCPHLLIGLCTCHSCGTAIHKGRYQHCCICPRDFNLCMECFDNGKRCESKHQLRILQVAMPMELMEDGLEKCLARQSKLTTLECDICRTLITQDRVYTCLICKDHNYDICSSCFSSGLSCLDTNDEHIFYTYMLAQHANFTAPSPYEKISNDGQARCNRCRQTIHQGPFLHCTKCTDFDLCNHCYETGHHCNDATHPLMKYFAYSQSISLQRSSVGGAFCDLCTVAVGDEDCYFGMYLPTCYHWTMD